MWHGRKQELESSERRKTGRKDGEREGRRERGGGHRLGGRGQPTFRTYRGEPLRETKL